MSKNSSMIQLNSGTSSLIIGLHKGTPDILHWGADLGSGVSEEEITGLFANAIAHNDSDIVRPFGIWRENARGHLGRPTLQAHRAGTDFSPLFAHVSQESDGSRAILVSEDAFARITVTAMIEAVANGLFRFTYRVRNDGDTPLTINDFDVWLQLPDRAVESMDFTGRWAKERQPQRRDIQFGTWMREGREGRPGFDHSIVQLALTRDATFQNGEVWALGVEFSGNPRYGVEMQPTGKKSMVAGTVILPGELILEPGEEYASAPVIAGYSDQGLDGATSLFHEWLRSRDNHPTKNKPRPLTLNVWEAVYFNHNLEKLSELADVAAAVGVERLVLDDGWFGSRRDDHSGLGDWTVSPEVWPEGLTPLIDKVTSSGMEFGLWFEGEMVNPASNLYREHPDWILKVADRVPPEGRHQQVLDFTNEEAFSFILESVSDVLANNNISYIKWDHNRALVDPGHEEHPAVLTQTHAIYRMFDELKKRFPGLEIESCSSGGARIDLGMAQHADRFWTSDCNEAKERQNIQRYTQMAIPPEMLGTHVGPTASHQTGRVLSLNFRALTALFGHAGIEWDITVTTADERETLRTWADYYKANRDLLHSGKVVRVGQPDDALWFHGVIAHDQSRALFAYLAMDTISGSTAPRFVLPGLAPERTYRVSAAFPTGVPAHAHNELPGWMKNGATISGRALERVGLVAPVLAPESGFVIECEAL
jgi:alpha-galactosidase